MIVRHLGAQSSGHALPYGGPQGDPIVMILFLVEVNDCGMGPPPLLPPGAGPGDVTCIPAPPPPAQSQGELQLKYFENFTVAESVNLEENLCNTIDRSRPKTYHERNGLVLPYQNSLVQRRLDELMVYTQNHNM